MEGLRKYVAECIGTFTLVLVGCGTAMLTGCEKWGGYLTTAFAFGLVIVGMAYCVGNISGCHINPAVSLACLISGRMSGKDFGLYFVSQTIGAILGAACLKLIFGLGGITDATGGLGSNGLGGVNGNIGAGLIAEIILTFIFILVILGVTDSDYKHGSFGGVVIGFSLVMVHILGIGLTGTSVNPARSIGPALFAGGAALSSLWVFIVGPFAGAALAAFCYKFLAGKK
ncbi:MAG: MIP family channel protein [Oscillospiraceae bacterium]|nr:MIP family channel protein [Oscillospiraceae bacterium]